MKYIRHFRAAVLLGVGCTAVLASPPAASAPADELMRPTQHEFHVTQKAVDGLSRYLVESEVDFGNVDADQKRQLAEALSRRFVATGVKHGQEAATSAQFLLNRIVNDFLVHVPLDAETARVYGEKLKPAPSIAQEFWDGFAEDARSLLDDEQFEHFSAWADSNRDFLRRVERRVDRWSRGEKGEEAGLLNRLWQEELPPLDKNKSRDRQQAESNARWQLLELGPTEWRRFLNVVQKQFAFDDGQKAASERVFQEYAAKARQIMTAEWRAKLRGNRIKYYATYAYDDQPLAPWGFALEEEYLWLTAPVEDLGRAFRQRILALATEAQRDKMMASIREAASRRGMTSEEIDPVRELFLEPKPPSQVSESQPHDESNSK